MNDGGHLLCFSFIHFISFQMEKYGGWQQRQLPFHDDNDHF